MVHTRRGSSSFAFRIYRHDWPDGMWNRRFRTRNPPYLHGLSTAEAFVPLINAHQWNERGLAHGEMAKCVIKINDYRTTCRQQKPFLSSWKCCVNKYICKNCPLCENLYIYLFGNYRSSGVIFQSSLFLFIPYRKDRIKNTMEFIITSSKRHIVIIAYESGNFSNWQKKNAAAHMLTIHATHLCESNDTVCDRGMWIGITIARAKIYTHILSGSLQPDLVKYGLNGESLTNVDTKK